MPELLRILIEPQGFLPLGHCYLWNPGLIFLHLASDALIGLAYLSISLKSDLLRDIPVAVLSALDVSRQENSVPGAAAYLKKPVDPTHLLATVSRLAAR